MLKERQIYHNELVVTAKEDAVTEYLKGYNSNMSDRRLRSCNAHVTTTDNWHLLFSFDTLVAVIDKRSGVCYDFLRYVYGYTSTSAQHITKFAHDYDATVKFTWRSE